MLFLTTFIVFPIVPPHVRIHTPASLAATAAAADRLIDADWAGVRCPITSPRRTHCPPTPSPRRTRYPPITSQHRTRYPPTPSPRQTCCPPTPSPHRTRYPPITSPHRTRYPITSPHWTRCPPITSLPCLTMITRR